MSDVFTPEKRSAVMARILSRGNKSTEIKLMEMLRAAGIRGWRRHARITVMGLGKSAKGPKVKVVGKRSSMDSQVLRVRPDFVFWRAGVALFVDGCFWHGCPRHGTQPKQNGEFWAAKIERNQKRDRKVARVLRGEGWTVLHIWECALSKAMALRTLGRIRRAVEAGLEE